MMIALLRCLYCGDCFEFLLSSPSCFCPACAAVFQLGKKAKAVYLEKLEKAA